MGETEQDRTVKTRNPIKQFGDRSNVHLHDEWAPVILPESGNVAPVPEFLLFGQLHNREIKRDGKN
jgi:hypothetical protein